MKKCILVLVVGIIAGFSGSLFGQNRFWVAASSSNWNNTANWSTSSGGPGGASVPGATEVAIFNANGAGNCNLDIAPTVAGITVNGYTGIINFQGNNLTTTGTNQFATGTLAPGTTASLILNTIATTTFSGTTVSVNVSGSTGRLFFNGSTFNGTINVTKTDSNNDFSSGNNVFNGTSTVTNAGDGFIVMGNTNRDQFNGVTTFNNTGSSRIYIAHNHGGQTTTFTNDVILNSNKSGGTDAWSFLICEGNNTAVSFGGNVTINCGGTLQSNHRILQGLGTQSTYAGTLTINATNSNSSTSINIGSNGTSVFNGNIIVTNPGGINGIYFNNGASASSTLAAARTISIGAGGFVAGQLALPRFTQTGSTSQTLNTLSGTAQLTIGPNSDFGGNVNFAAPRLFLNGAIYRGAASLEKTGASRDFSSGGNTFQGTTTITNSGSDEFVLGNGNADIFNGATTFNNTGSFRIRVAYNHSGQTTTFNGNVTLNSNKSGGTDQWSFLLGEVNDSNLAFNGSLTINCAGTLRSDHRFLNGGGSVGTYGPVNINLTNTNPSTIITMGVNGTSNYTQNIILSNPGGTNGVSFNSGASASSSLAASKTITIGAGGFAAGTLSLPRFVQTAATNQALTLTGTASLILGPASQFGGNVNFASPRLLLNGCTYGGTATLEKTGAVDDSGNGGNIFQGVATITNSGTGYLLTGNVNADQFNDATTFNVIGSGRLHFAQNHAGQTTTFASTVLLNMNKSGAVDPWGILFCEGANTAVTFGGAVTIQNSGTFETDTRFVNGAGSTAIYNGPVNVVVTNSNAATQQNMGTNGVSTFNENIQISNSGGANGVFFNTGASGSSTLAAGKSIAVGALGFTTGDLRIRRFTQADAATPQTLLLTGTASLVLGPSIAFSGNSDFRAPQVFLNGGTFNGTALIEKTGATDNTGSGNMTFQSTTTLRLSGTGFYRTNGGNTFNGPTSIINNGSNYILFELVSGSTYNGDLTLINAGSSTIRMGYTGTTTFNGNIEVNSTSGNGIYFVDSGTGSATLATGKTISTGSTGFTTGELRLARFTQSGTTAQNIVFTGTAGLRVGPTTTWNGNFTSSSPAIFLDGAVFNGTTNSITKTGSTTDTSIGGNTFAAGTTSTLVNSGTGIFRLANTTADDFIGNAVFNQSSGILQPAYSTASTFRGDVTVNGATAITFGAAGGGNAVFTGTANQTVNKAGTASPIFNRLTMNKASGTVTLNTDARVGTAATFTAGILNTTTVNYLDFVDNATVTGASNSSFVDGPVRKTGNDVFTFPIGDNNFYRPAAISAPTNTAHFFTAQYFNADHGLGSNGDPSFISVTKCEYWQIDRNTGASSNVLVTLSWQEAACVAGYITDPPTLRVTRWNGSSWVNLGNGGTTGTATNGTIVTSSTVTAFNTQFTLASVSLANPLPVELTWFKASITKSGTGLLEWRTESELNNDRFEIERSENGINFTSLGSVDGSGTTNKAHDYQFEDARPVLSLVYYRLKQVDFDGAFEYSDIVALDFTDAEVNSGRLLVAPNPANTGSYVSFGSVEKPVKQSVTIYNAMNQAVREYSNADGFNTEGLTAGIYIVRNQAGEIFRLVIK